jgi:hypothetical protein
MVITMVMVMWVLLKKLTYDLVFWKFSASLRRQTFATVLKIPQQRDLNSKSKMHLEVLGRDSCTTDT